MSKPIRDRRPPLFAARVKTSQRVADLFDDEAVAESDDQHTVWYDADRDLAVIEYFHASRAEAENRLAALHAFVQRHAPAAAWESAIRELPAEDWAETWKKFFHAEKVSDRVWVKPSWESCPAAPGDVVVEIDPGMSFGTGQHGTTRGCLQMLDRFAIGRDGARPSGIRDKSSPSRLEGRPPCRPSCSTLADIGCGSGILAIAAAKLGYEGILAVDNDPVAVRVARENAALNGVADRISFQTGALGEAPISGRYDVVVANILATVLTAQAGVLSRLLAPAATARLIVSGILNTQADEVVAAYATQGLTPVNRLDIGEWTTFCMGRS
jgi:ribosomal protein L11 methyltransferase